MSTVETTYTREQAETALTEMGFKPGPGGYHHADGRVGRLMSLPVDPMVWPPAPERRAFWLQTPAVRVSAAGAHLGGTIAVLGTPLD